MALDAAMLSKYLNFFLTRKDFCEIITMHVEDL